MFFNWYKGCHNSNRGVRRVDCRKGVEIGRQNVHNRRQSNTLANQCRLKVYLAPNSPSDTSSEAEPDSDSEPKTKTQPPPKKRKLSQYWIADLDLKTSDKSIIERGRELTDRHMEAAHKVLAEQFPHLQGLQSTLLAQTGSFTPVSECSGFIPEG